MNFENYAQIKSAREDIRRTEEYQRAFEDALVHYHGEAHRDALKKVCPHTIHSYEPDASGNNDGGYSCDICDKWLGKHYAG